MSSSKPVIDWATDFDYLDPQWVQDPYPIWDALRAECPIAHSERYMGTNLPTRYDDIRAIAGDTEHFSSRRVILREGRPPVVPAPPLTSDPPEHKAYRKILIPAFTVDAVNHLEPRIRAICRENSSSAFKGGRDAMGQLITHRKFLRGLPLICSALRKTPALFSVTGSASFLSRESTISKQRLA